MVTINFDKLELSLKQTPETDCFLEYYEEGREMVKGAFLLYNPRPLTDFKCVWEVFDNSQNLRLGLFFVGFKKFANVDYCRFKFDDSLFYQQNFDFAGSTTRFCNALNLQYKGVSSLDIAFDTDEACIFPGYKFSGDEITHRAKGETGGISVAQFVVAASRGAVIREAKFNRSKIIPIAEFSGRNGGYYDTFYMGQRGSSVFARVYNKSLEMQENGQKTFITEDWRQRGYDEKNPVWRFEISFNHLSAKRGRLMIDLPESGFLLLSDAIQQVSKTNAPAFFFAAQKEFFTFTTKGGNSSRKTMFYNNLSYNCGYVLAIKKVKQPKQQKDIIKYNNVTRYFAKYTRGIFRTPEARAYFDINQRINANAFVLLYEELHAKYEAAKGEKTIPENNGFYLKIPQAAPGCPNSIT